MRAGRRLKKSRPHCRYTSMKTSITIATILLMNTVAAVGQAQLETSLRFQLGTESSITIEGTSTVNSFQCKSSYIQGVGSLVPNATRSGEPELYAELAAQVKLFECGQKRMTQDLWKALKSDRYPVIFYVLDTAVAAPGMSENETIIHSTGRLTIAGVERPIDLELRADQISVNHYRLIGKQDILMSDFGIEPPTALMGLIKAHDQITLIFELNSVATLIQSTQD
jgi:hypothetical protein